MERENMRFSILCTGFFPIQFSDDSSLLSEVQTWDLNFCLCHLFLVLKHKPPNCQNLFCSSQTFEMQLLLCLRQTNYCVLLTLRCVSFQELFFFFWKRLSFLPHLSFSLLSEATLGWNSQATCQGREDHRKDTAHPSPRFISAPVVCVNKPIIRGMGFHKHIYKMRTCVLTEIWQSDSWTFWDLKAFANVGKIVIIRENLLPPDYENRWQKN